MEINWSPEDMARIQRDIEWGQTSLSGALGRLVVAPESVIKEQEWKILTAELVAALEHIRRAQAEWVQTNG